MSGLEKYLTGISALKASASITSIADLFPLWDTIADALVSRSRFLTLVDIYGHYANRGDTIVVTTRFHSKASTTAERALLFFSQSKNCGAILDTEAVRTALGIQPARLSALIGELRGIRYDVRTEGTHATLKRGELLCTYPFPVLSAKAHFDRSRRREREQTA